MRLYLTIGIALILLCPPPTAVGQEIAADESETVLNRSTAEAVQHPSETMANEPSGTEATPEVADTDGTTAPDSAAKAPTPDADDGAATVPKPGTSPAAHKPRIGSAPKGRTVERDSVRKLMLLMGPGVSMGSFFIDEVLVNVDDWRLDQGSIEQGFVGLLFNLAPRLSFCFAPIEYVQISALVEVGWAPEIHSIRSMLRFTVGGTVDAHIPIKRRYSIFLGGGVLFHSLKFEDWKVATPGYRGQIGFRIYSKIGKRFTPEFIASFDYLEPSTNSPQDETHKMKLRSLGVIVGANIYFTLTGQS